MRKILLVVALLLIPVLVHGATYIDLTTGAGTTIVKCVADTCTLSDSIDISKLLTGTQIGFVTTGLTAGKIYYRKSDGTWDQADANAAGKFPARCFATSTTFCAISGLYTSTSHGKTVGATLFITDAVGDIDTTASASVVQAVGWVYDANTYYIRVSPDYFE